MVEDRQDSASSEGRNAVIGAMLEVSPSNTNKYRYTVTNIFIHLRNIFLAGEISASNLLAYVANGLTVLHQVPELRGLSPFCSSPRDEKTFLEQRIDESLLAFRQIFGGLLTIGTVEKTSQKPVTLQNLFRHPAIQTAAPFEGSNETFADPDAFLAAVFFRILHAHQTSWHNDAMRQNEMAYTIASLGVKYQNVLEAAYKFVWDMEGLEARLFQANVEAAQAMNSHRKAVERMVRTGAEILKRDGGGDRLMGLQELIESLRADGVDHTMLNVEILSPTEEPPRPARQERVTTASAAAAA